MDFVSEFEKNVHMRMKDIVDHSSMVKKEKSEQNLLPSVLFVGISLGIAASRIACLCIK